MATINAGDIFATLKLKDEMSGTIGNLASKFGPMAAALGAIAVAAGTAHKALMAQAEAAQQAVAQVSTADELAKLKQLKDAGAITDAEYESLKAKVMS